MLNSYRKYALSNLCDINRKFAYPCVKPIGKCYEKTHTPVQQWLVVFTDPLPCIISYSRVRRHRYASISSDVRERRKIITSTSTWNKNSWRRFTQKFISISALIHVNLSIIIHYVVFLIVSLIFVNDIKFMTWYYSYRIPC